MAEAKWPHGHSDKHREAALKGWREKRRRYGGKKEDTTMGQYKKAAKGKSRKERRELLHTFSEDVKYYQDRDRKRKIAHRAYTSATAQELRTKRSRATKARRASEGKPTRSQVRTRTRVHHKSK